MLVGNTTSVPDYYKYFLAAPSKNQPAQRGFLQAWFGKLECLSSEGGGRKLFLHPASLVKKSFPLHSQPQPRAHRDKGLPPSPFFSKNKSKTSPSIRVTAQEHQPFVFQPLLHVIEDDSVHPGLFPHARSPSWVTWLPGSHLLLWLSQTFKPGDVKLFQATPGWNEANSTQGLCFD